MKINKFIIILIFVCIAFSRSILGQYVITKSKDTVLNGSSLTITCNTSRKVDGIAWTRDDNSFLVSQGSGTSCTGDMPPQYDFTCSQGILYNLTIPSITFIENGIDWRCQGEFGGDDSNTIIVNVTVPLQKVSITTGSTPVKPGILTQMNCSTNPCYPEAVITWTLDGTKITDGIASSTEIINVSGVVTRSSLNKKYSIEHDGKSLVCSAANGAYDVSSNITLIVRDQINGSGSVSSIFYVIITFINTSVITGLL